MEANKKTELLKMAARIRMGVVTGTFYAKSGHPGGSLSIADLLAYLYTDVMRVDPQNPNDPERDRLVLSKGHCCPALYAALALRGFFDFDALKTLRAPDSFLQGHPDRKKTPGVDMSTGSLGQGISAACGMALAGKLDHKDYRVYAILGDGEMQEGEVWEALMFAAHQKLSNLTVFADLNGLQIDGPVDSICSLGDICAKYEAFGFDVYEADGHDFDSLEQALAHAPAERPRAILMHTHKGRGVSFMEDQVGWHGKAPNEEQYKQAMAELEAKLDELEGK